VLEFGQVGGLAGEHGLRCGHVPPVGERIVEIARRSWKENPPRWSNLSAWG